MRHQLPTLICVAFLVPAAAGARPVLIAQERQLFVDDYIVEGVENVAFTLHQPEKHPGNPVLMADKPWEAKSLALYDTVLFDDEENLFKMWYRAIEDTCYACYATSQDGIHWKKPVLNARAYKGSTANNIVLGSVSPKFYLDGFAVIKDLDEDKPARRYKMLTYNGDRHEHALHRRLTGRRRRFLEGPGRYRGTDGSGTIPDGEREALRVLVRARTRRDLPRADERYGPSRRSKWKGACGSSVTVTKTGGAVATASTWTRRMLGARQPGSCSQACPSPCR